MSAELPEVKEADAQGRTAEIYEEIRRAVGLPLVNLVYRVLAASDRLDSAWAQLKPNLCDPAIGAAAARVIEASRISDAPAVPASALAAAGIDARESASARSTIDAYLHSNPRNLIVITALLEPGQPRAGARAAREPDATPDWDVLPMADLASLTPETRALLEDMSRPIVAPGEALLVPSLLRHFGHNPCFLALLWTAIAPVAAAGAVEDAAERVFSCAEKEALELPHPVQRLVDAPTRDVLERFRLTISRMIVVSQLMRQSVAPTS